MQINSINYFSKINLGNKKQQQPAFKQMQNQTQMLNTIQASAIKPTVQNFSFSKLFEPYKKALLMILDGWGIGAKNELNPFAVAKTPFLDSLKNNDNGFTLYKEIGAAGEYVGLDKKEVGNSEVGHSNIGTGRKVEQAMTRIDRALEDGSFFENKEFLNAMNHVKKNNSTLHIAGALGYSHTHTKFEHYEALIKMAREQGVNNLAMHIFTNGEGPTQTTSLEYVQNLNTVLEKYGYPHVATVMGRNIAMDKSSDWDKIEQAYYALTDGYSSVHSAEVTDGLSQLFKLGIQGVVMPPFFANDSKRISDNDALIFANYRADRAREITSVLTQEETKAPFMKYKKRPENFDFICMTRYDDNFNLPVAFDNPIQEGTLLEVLSKNGVKCSTAAQKEKSAHVDFFFNGSRSMEFENVNNHIIDPHSETSDPELNLPKVCEQVLKDIESDDVDFIVTNFANSDIVGHKGDFNLAVKEIELMDKHVKECVEKAIRNDIAVVITADHGNIEEPSHTKHTKNKVPCYVILPKHKEQIYKLKNIGVTPSEQSALQDIAPTILDIMGKEKDEHMTGSSLLING